MGCVCVFLCSICFGISLGCSSRFQQLANPLQITQETRCRGVECNFELGTLCNYATGASIDRLYQLRQNAAGEWFLDPKTHPDLVTLTDSAKQLGALAEKGQALLGPRPQTGHPMAFLRGLLGGQRELHQHLFGPEFGLGGDQESDATTKLPGHFSLAGLERFTEKNLGSLKPPFDISKLFGRKRRRKRQDWSLLLETSKFFASRLPETATETAGMPDWAKGVQLPDFTVLDSSTTPSIPSSTTGRPLNYSIFVPPSTSKRPAALETQVLTTSRTVKLEQEQYSTIQPGVLIRDLLLNLTDVANTVQKLGKKYSGDSDDIKAWWVGTAADVGIRSLDPSFGSRFAYRLLNPGERAVMMSYANFNDRDYYVEFQFQTSNGLVIRLCCDTSSKCPVFTEGTVQNTPTGWSQRAGICYRGTRTVLFICENKSTFPGACAIDNLRIKTTDGKIYCDTTKQ